MKITFEPRDGVRVTLELETDPRRDEFVRDEIREAMVAELYQAIEEWVQRCTSR